MVYVDFTASIQIADMRIYTRKASTLEYVACVACERFWSNPRMVLTFGLYCAFGFKDGTFEGDIETTVFVFAVDAVMAVEDTANV